MGKTSRKMAKKQEKHKVRENQQAMEAVKETFQQLFAEEKYDEALNTLAELIQGKCYDAELFYQGAFCYFMLGDYQRAGEWINNTLAYDANHIEARILLARLCILEEREEDGLKIFEFILAHWGGELSEETKEGMEEILAYYGRNEPEKLQKQYPQIALFLGLASDEQTEKKPHMVVQTLSLGSEEANQAEEETSLTALKKRLLAAADEVAEESVVPDQPTTPEPMAAAEQQKQDVLGKDIAMIEKIKLLNAFAGVQYYAGAYDAAVYLLQAACALDGQQADTLRNLCFAAAAMGRKEEALAYAAKLPMADFAVLDKLRNMPV